ncbi:hypothetical protein [Natronorubrum sp. A-ect3]|uniref:hypothetical protein n=1 Tax=Natronorubrum sp. A-ect3 TaxID=3242698 RepID=UPI00359D5EB5
MTDSHSNGTEDTDDEAAESDSDDTTITTSAAGVGVTTGTATVTIGFSTDDIQDRLDDDKIAEALVLTSTRLENILSQAIADRYDITNEQFEKLYGRESLGRYQDMAAVLGLFDQHQGTLQDVVRYRKKLVHDYGYLDELQTDNDERDDVKSVLEAAVAFIDQVEF